MEDKRSFFSQIFTNLMIFSLAVGASTGAFIYAWPWEKTAPAWKPTFRLVAACGEKKEACGLSYGELADAKTQGRLTALEPSEPAGEIEEEQNWLKWKKEGDTYEVKASSWHFQTVVRYRIENDAPVLLAYQDVDVPRAFTYGIGAALFLMIGLGLRKLRG